MGGNVLDMKKQTGYSVLDVRPYMAARMHVLMDAAETLIRAEQSTDFTMRALADMAKVSPATPYNVFESKAGLLFALLNRSLDQVIANWESIGKSMAPHERVLRAGEVTATFFTDDAVFYRPLYGYLIGNSHQESRKVFMQRARDFWHKSTDGIEAAGGFPAELPQTEVGRQLTTIYLGVMHDWAFGEIEDEEFVIRVGYGAAALLLGLAVSTGDRQALLVHLGNYRRALGKLS